MKLFQKKTTSNWRIFFSACGVHFHPRANFCQNAKKYFFLHTALFDLISFEVLPALFAILTRSLKCHSIYTIRRNDMKRLNFSEKDR